MPPLPTERAIFGLTGTWFFGLLHLLAVGAIVEQPVVRDGEITTAHLMALNLACDHRILYGAEGAEFLARVRSLLTEPLGLAL